MRLYPGEVLWASNGRIFRFRQNGCRYSSRRPVAPPLSRSRRHRDPVPNLAKAGCDARPRHLGMSRRGAIIAARALYTTEAHTVVRSS